MPTQVRQVITPEFAHELLSKNERNRRLNKTRVTRYANDILSGRWTECSEMITVDTDGKLTNGQHRLEAIIKANMPVTMTVAYDWPKDAVIDRGMERSTGDALYMRGLIDKVMSSGPKISIVNRYLEIATGKKQDIIPDTYKADFINNNIDDIRKAYNISFLGKTGSKAPLARASCQAAILGALIAGVPEDILRDFAHTVNTGCYRDEKMKAAIQLKRYIDTHDMNNGASAANDCASVTEMAIKDFAARVPRVRQYSPKDHIYILPLNINE